MNLFVLCQVWNINHQSLATHSVMDSLMNLIGSRSESGVMDIVSCIVVSVDFLLLKMFVNVTNARSSNNVS